MTERSVQKICIAGNSVFSDQFASTMEEILMAADGPGKVFLLEQIEPCGESSLDWYYDLKDELLFDNLVSRICRFYELTAKIAASESYWIYLCGADCFNEYFELARSCDAILCYSRAIKLGFPITQSGGFPIGVAMIRLLQADRKAGEAWLERPVDSVLNLAKDGMVELLIDKEYPWDVVTSEWLANHGPTLKKKHEEKKSFLGLGYQWFRKESPKALDQLRLEGESSAHRGVWSVFYQAATKGLLNGQDAHRFLAELAGRFYFADVYLDWLFRSIPVGLNSKIKVSPTGDSRLVEIHLQEVLPPTQLLRELLEGGWVLVFVALEADFLLSSLEILYGKLAKACGSIKRDEFWRSKVFWGIGAPSRGGLILASFPYDRLQLNRGPSSVNFQFYTNIGSHHLVEVTTKGEVASGFLEVFETLTSDVICVEPLGRMCLSVSDFILARIFEELMKISNRAARDIELIIGDFKSLGWERLGSLIVWERFLSIRHTLYRGAVDDVRVGFLELDNLCWNVSTLREAATVAGELADVGASVAEFDAQIAVLCGVLSLCLVMDNAVASLPQAEALVSRVVGYPSYLPVSHSFVTRQSRRRIIFDHGKALGIPDQFPVTT